jgi:hypothetical protein
MTPYGQCYYYQPLYGYVVMLAAIQALVILPLCSLWYSYTVSETGFRGLPSFFIFQKRFWAKGQQQPGTPEIRIANLAVAFKHKTKACKKEKRKQAITFGKTSLGLKNVNFR